MRIQWYIEKWLRIWNMQFDVGIVWWHCLLPATKMAIDVKCELNPIEMYKTIQRKFIQYLYYTLHTVHKVDITVGKLLFDMLTKSVENWDKLLKSNIVCSGWFEVFTIRPRNKLLKMLQRVLMHWCGGTTKNVCCE